MRFYSSQIRASIFLLPFFFSSFVFYSRFRRLISRSSILLPFYVSFFYSFIFRSNKTPLCLFFLLFILFVGDTLIPSNTHTHTTYLCTRISRDSTIRDQRLYANTLERALRYVRRICKNEAGRTSLAVSGAQNAANFRCDVYNWMKLIFTNDAW